MTRMVDEKGVYSADESSSVMDECVLRLVGFLLFLVSFVGIK